MKEIGSGIHDRKKGLKELLSKINNPEISKGVILFKDRLVRFGDERMEYLCPIKGVEVEMMDNTESSKEQEGTDDLIQRIPVFANRLYGQRSKKWMEEVKANAVSKEDTTETDPGTGSILLEKCRCGTMGIQLLFV